MILKIGQQLAKLWAKVGCPVFLTHGDRLYKRRRRGWLLTEDVEPGLGTAKCDAGGDVGGDTAQRARVLVAIDARYAQITAVLPASTRVRHRLAVERPVERDLVPVGHVAAQSNAAALDHVLADRRRVEVEAVLVASACDHCSQADNTQCQRYCPRCHFVDVHTRSRSGSVVYCGVLYRVIL